VTDRIAQATGASAKHYAPDAYGNRICAGGQRLIGDGGGVVK
jgi:hypothetical protein